jgi:hypothetical protein
MERAERVHVAIAVIAMWIVCVGLMVAIAVMAL